MNRVLASARSFVSIVTVEFRLILKDSRIPGTLPVIQFNKGTIMSRLIFSVLVFSVLENAASAQTESKDNPADAKKPIVVKQQNVITISKETTHLTEPLTGNGFVDYIAALNQKHSKGVTPENNATVAFLRIFGPGEIGSESSEQFFRMLEIPEVPRQGDYFESIREYVIANGANPNTPEGRKRIENAVDQYSGEATSRPWSRKEFPVVAEWQDANKKQFDQIIEMTRRPKMYSPLISPASPESQPMMISVLLPVTQGTREAARILLGHAMRQLSDGKVAEAQQEVLACHRLARLVGQGPTIIEALVGIAIESMACRGDAMIVDHGNLTEKQAKQFQADLGKLTSMPRMVDKLSTAERFMYLDVVSSLAQGGSDDLFGNLGGVGIASGGNQLANGIKKVLTQSMLDWDEVLRSGNEMYDKMEKAAGNSSRAERLKAFGRLNEELKQSTIRARATFRNPLSIAAALFLSRKAKGRLMGGILNSLLLPALNQAMEAEDRSTTRLQLAQTAYALAGYRAKFGSYPQGLSQLAPKYIPKVPRDLYSGHSFRYFGDSDDFLLYSVGTNGQDDSGLTFDSIPRGDDIVVDTRPKMDNDQGDN
jgi:hypothetical protein